MAQYSPLSTNLGVSDFGVAYDRSVVFPLLAAAIDVTSIDVWVGAGLQVRAALYSGISSTTTTGATLVVDFGVVTNIGVSDAFINVTTPTGTSLAIGKYPIICERQNTAVGVVGDGAFPFGDAIYASRAFNNSDPYITAFPSTIYDDEAVDSSFRIPYARLNYTLSATTSIDTITTGGVSGLKVGSGFAITTTGLGNLTSVTIETAGLSGAIVTAQSLSAFAGDGNGIEPAWVIGEKYPKPGTVSVVATDVDSKTATTTTTLSIPDGLLDTEFDNLVLIDSTYLGKALSDFGHPIVDGERGYYPNTDGLAIDANGHISVSNATTVVMYIQKLDGTMESYTLNITESGAITGVDINHRLWIGVGIGI